ncbi:hypothetical protein ACL9RL_03860 [Plantibacter sp. Mn2098]|uniref:hypothetical protein n=1 Tax=Plantibacter sp. Mn2098 TaxID=3395266 RepID=UPI003BB9CF8D
MSRFTVDASVLADAAAVAAELGTWKIATGLSDLPTGSEQLGHAGLADALATFRSRWETGASELVEDVRTVGASLAGAAAEYNRLDDAVGSMLTAPPREPSPWRVGPPLGGPAPGGSAPRGGGR